MPRQTWWNRWYGILGLALLSAIPLLWPSTPTLVDVPGHLGRFRVQLDLSSSQFLQRYFEFKWRLIGNLGTDLLIIPLNSLVGLELGVKLLVLTIPVLTTLGSLLVAREIDRDIPPTALFAIPFVYGYPFNFGFINFALSMAFALLAYALWLRLGSTSKLTIRAVLFVPLSCLIWITHVFGWGVLGLLSWSSEFVRLRNKKVSWPRAGSGAASSCLPITFPLVLMIVWRSGDVAGQTVGYFDAAAKTLSLLSALRDRWLLWDSISVGVALVLIGSAIFDRHLEFSRRLAIPAAVMAVIFLVMPGQVFGSAYADMRLAPYMLMLALLSIRPRPHVSKQTTVILAAFATAFVVLRLAGNTVSFFIADEDANRQLEALKYIPDGAPVLSLVGDSCSKAWKMPRHSHLGSFVITRKHGFSNDQWQLSGGQLMRVIYAPARPFVADPSEVTISRKCQERIIANLRKQGRLDIWQRGKMTRRTTDEALDQFPQDAFDFVWLIEPEGLTHRPRPYLKLVWASNDSALYQVRHTLNLPLDESLMQALAESGHVSVERRGRPKAPVESPLAR